MVRLIPDGCRRYPALKVKARKRFKSGGTAKAPFVPTAAICRVWERRSLFHLRKENPIMAKQEEKKFVTHITPRNEDFS